MIREELRLLFTALMFLTRFPCPAWVGHGGKDTSRSVAYFPVVGILVGGIGALVSALARAGYGAAVAALCGIAATVIVTGAFHEDAFADVCDGFGGWTPQRRLEIMRDSRLGTYGVVGLILLVGLKGLLLAAMTARHAALAFVTAHTLGRCAAVLMLARFPPPPNTKSLAGAFGGALSPVRLLVAGALTVAVCALSGAFAAFLLCTASLLLCLLAGRFFLAWLGGVSGDCIGAVTQVTELLCYFIIARM